MTTREDWQVVNTDLHKVANDLLSRLDPRTATDPVIRIVHAFVNKAARTLLAVNVLYANDLPEQAQVLVRILLELRFSFDCFLRMMADDPRAACLRIIDSMMLEKMKQQRASNFVGLDLVPGAPSREELEQAEQIIVKRYSAQEIEKMKRHGFTGMSVEQRATAGGHAEVYNVIYRNFSRNVHSSDYLENFMHQPNTALPDPTEYRNERDHVSLYAAHFSVGGILEYTNAAFGCGLDDILDLIGKKQASLRKSQRRQRE